METSAKQDRSKERINKIIDAAIDIVEGGEVTSTIRKGIVDPTIYEDANKFIIVRGLKNRVSILFMSKDSTLKCYHLC